MKSDVKNIVIILVVTAIIVIAGLSLTTGTKAKNEVSIQKDILISTTTPMIIGMKSPDAERISVVEFADFACPACSMLSPNIDKLLKEYDGRIDYGFRIIPIHGELSYNSAIAAFAAGKQGKFFEMSTKLFEKQEEWTAVNASTTALFRGYAKEVGVSDLGLYDKDIESETFRKVIRQMVDRDRDHARAMNIHSTPTVIIGAEHISVGVVTYEDLKGFVENSLAKAKASAGSSTTTTTN